MSAADRQALLDALRDDPNDERLRLVYADWLDDHGQHDRAEYIRLCYELSGLDADNPHAVQLEQRRASLFRRHKRHWGPRLPKPVAEVLAHRGLVHRIEVTAAQFLKIGDALHGEPLACVALRKARGKMGEVFDSPALDGVRELAILDSNLHDDDVAALAASPRLAGLRVLRLAACDIEISRAAILATSPYLGNLRTLDLGHYHRRDEDIDNTVWRNVGLSNIMSRASTNHLHDEGFLALLDSPHLGNLEALIVTNNWISPVGFRRLWDAGRFPNLRRLDLSFNYLGPDGLRELAESPLMGQLEMLEVQANEVGSEGIRHLAASPNVRRLRLLDASGTNALVDNPRLDNSAAAALAHSPHLAALQHLILSVTEIGAAGAKALAKSATLPALRTLSLSASQIGDAGARAFASSDLLRQLTTLDLSANGLTSAGGRGLAKSSKAGEELSLELSGNEFDAETRARLTERFGERVGLSGASEE